MAMRTPTQLRDAAEEFRDMAPLGDDLRLQAALFQVADEFDAEADRLEGLMDPPGVPVTLSPNPHPGASTYLPQPAPSRG
jgi:hypothetical protein